MASRSPTADLLAERAPAKVNLALHITARRSDGYHELDSLVVFADVADRVILNSSGHGLTVTGPLAGALAGDAPESNLVLKAWRAMARLYPDRVPEGGLILEKHLPVAAGIGGGSADAAAAIRLYCRAAGLDPSAPEIVNLALSLGADVPVCLKGVPSRMSGIGEVLSALPGARPNFGLVLANPGVAVPTGPVFKALDLTRLSGPLPDAAKGAGWRTHVSALANDLQEPALALAPVIGDVLEELKQSGAEPVRMSGSGATCFGLYPCAEDAAKAADFLKRAYSRWWIWGGGLAEPPQTHSAI